VTDHRIVVHQDDGDDFPWVSIECDWGDNPDRPCIVVDCSRCEDDGSTDCLIEHPAIARAMDGCGVQNWLAACGPEGVVVHDMEVRVPVSKVYFDGDGWVLECGEEK
jgi:hypothetical protein